MPDMDGVKVLRTLKQNPSTSHIPVVAVSSLAGTNGEKLIREGAHAYYEKGSMTAEKLEQAVSGVLNNRLLIPDDLEVTAD
jgi:CheY-like chemotaxis protein